MGFSLSFTLNEPPRLSQPRVCPRGHSFNKVCFSFKGLVRKDVDKYYDVVLKCLRAHKENENEKEEKVERIFTIADFEKGM